MGSRLHSARRSSAPCSLRSSSTAALSCRGTDWSTAFGENSPPSSAAQSLQVYVHGLRRALGSNSIETSGSGYRIRLDDAQLDLDRFERFVERGRRSLEAGEPEDASDELRRGLALWSGSALADLPAAAPVAAEGARLEELRLSALELQNDAELACGRHDALIATLDALVAEHPYRERFREQHILALYRAGRQKDALEAFRATRQVLVEELGIEPGQRLQELERAILRQEPSLATPVQEPRAAMQLPAPPTPLIGRRLEIAAVAALLREEGVRLVTLTGPGGTGKTRLALAVAAELGPDLRDGAVFADLAPISDPDLLVPAIAAALGVPEGDEPLTHTVAEHVRSRRMLLVLDNLERILSGAPFVSELLAAAPRLLVVATSRAPLHLAAEHEYPVPPFAVPDEAMPFEELVRTDAVGLFTARARAVNPSFRLTEGSARSVARICRRLDGLPLAIELAAARTRMLPPESIEKRVSRALEVLVGGPQDVPLRQQTLRATLDWSYEALPETERVLFAQLAVFAGGWTLEAAEAVWIEGDRVLETLSTLLDVSLLLRRDGADGSTRFGMLETIREYALERLVESGEERDARIRHAGYFADFAERSEEGLKGEGQREWLAQVASEHDNIRSALGWLLSRPAPGAR